MEHGLGEAMNEAKLEQLELTRRDISEVAADIMDGLDAMTRITNNGDPDQSGHDRAASSAVLTRRAVFLDDMERRVDQIERHLGPE